MSKIASLQTKNKKHTIDSNGGETSKQLKESSLIQKEQSKLNEMFSDKNMQEIKKNIQNEVINYIKSLDGMFNTLQSSVASLSKSKDTISLKLASNSLSSVALSFFSETDSLIKSIEALYEQNSHMLSPKELKKLKNIVKSLNIALTMTLAFYETSQKMVNKLDLESEEYEIFEKDLFKFLEINKTIQTRINSNLSAFKPEQIKIVLLDDSKTSFFDDQAKTLSGIKSKFKTSSSILYNNIKETSSFLRDEKRNNDEKLSKKIAKGNL